MRGPAILPLHEPTHGGDAGGAARSAAQDPALRGSSLSALSSGVPARGRVAFALPQQEFGLNVIALVGRLPYGTHASFPRSMPSCAGAASTSPSAASPNCCTAMTSWLPSPPPSPAGCTGGSQPRAGPCWRSMGFNPMSAPRCCGWCVSACRARSCSPAPCRACRTSSATLLPARGGPSRLRGRPARQKGTQEAGAERAAGRACGGAAHGCRGRGGARLLRRGAQRDHR